MVFTSLLHKPSPTRHTTKTRFCHTATASEKMQGEAIRHVHPVTEQRGEHAIASLMNKKQLLFYKIIPISHNHAASRS